MLTHGFNGSMGKAVLLAGDLDFRPIVEALVRTGVFVEIWYQRNSIAQDLPGAADFGHEIRFRQFYSWNTKAFKEAHPIPREDLHAGAPSGELVKVANWDWSANSPSSSTWDTAWLQTKVFFQAWGSGIADEFTNPKSCVSVFRQAAGEPMQEIYHATEAAGGVGSAAILASMGARSFANSLLAMKNANPMFGGQLDPIAGPAVIAGATAVASAAGRFGLAAEGAAAEYLPPVAVGALLTSVVWGVSNEIYSAVTGKCH